MVAKGILKSITKNFSVFSKIQVLFTAEILYAICSLSLDVKKDYVPYHMSNNFFYIFMFITVILLQLLSVCRFSLLGYVIVFRFIGN